MSNEERWQEPDWKCSYDGYVNMAVRSHCRHCQRPRPLSETLNPRARLGDPQTSHDAAHSLNLEKLSRCRAEIYRLLRLRPRSDEDLAQDPTWQGFPQSPSSLRTRRAELVDAGLVRQSGRLGVTRSGRKTIIWETAPQHDEQLDLVGAME